MTTTSNEHAMALSMANTLQRENAQLRAQLTTLQAKLAETEKDAALLAMAKKEWATKDMTILMMVLEDTKFDCGLIAEMLQFAKDAAIAQNGKE